MNNSVELNELTEKLETLETRQAFQDDTIESLNKVLIEQQKDIEHLQLKVNILQDRIKQSGESHVSNNAEEPPPHY